MEFLPEIPSLLYTSCLVHPSSVMPCQHNSPPTLGPMALNLAQPIQPITCVQRLISTEGSGHPVEFDCMPFHRETMSYITHALFNYV